MKPSDESSDGAAAASVGQPSRVRFAVLAWLCLAAALSYISRNAIAVAESTVRTDLGLSKDQSGWLMSAFFISYSVFQIPGAWAGQRLGARAALPLFATAWSLATAAMTAGGAVALVFWRVVKGVAQAGLFPVSTGVIAKWFPKDGRAFATGALGSFMSVGGAAGAALTGLLVVQIGWRWTFALYAIPGALWAVWFWIWFRNTPEQHASVNDAERRRIQPERPAAGAAGAARSTPWNRILRSPAMWCICGQQFFRAAGYTFFTSWFATYLQEGRGVTIETSGILTMLPLLSVVAGNLAGGMVSDAVFARTGSVRLARQAVAGGSLAVCAVLTFAAYGIADPLAAVILISFGSFFAAVAGPCSYTITIDLGGDHVPAVNSLMNMCGNFGAMLFPIVVPWILRGMGGWNAVLLVFGAVHIAAAVCWWVLPPRGTIVTKA